MKKTFTIVALAAALCACHKPAPQLNSNNYGYIDLGISADESMGTKAVTTVDDFAGWTVLVGTTPYTGATMPIAAGTYTVSAKNFASMEAANTGRGAAFYSGETAGVVVTAGSTATPTIACGKAKNARFKVVFADTFTSIATDYSFTTKDTRAIVFDGTKEKSTPAYYPATLDDEHPSTVDYRIDYTFGTTPKVIEGTIKLGAAATEKTITIQGNSNGTITINITYDDTFGNGGAEEITIDGATGGVATK